MYTLLEKLVIKSIREIQQKNPTPYKIQKGKKNIIKQSKPVQINIKYKFLCFKPKVVNLITTSDRPYVEYPQLGSHCKKK